MENNPKLLHVHWLVENHVSIEQLDFQGLRFYTEVHSNVEGYIPFICLDSQNKSQKPNSCAKYSSKIYKKYKKIITIRSVVLGVVNMIWYDFHGYFTYRSFRCSDKFLLVQQCIYKRGFANTCPANKGNLMEQEVFLD